MEKKVYVVTAAVYCPSDDNLWCDCLGLYDTYDEAQEVIDNDREDNSPEDYVEYKIREMIVKC